MPLFRGWGRQGSTSRTLDQGLQRNKTAWLWLRPLGGARPTKLAYPEVLAWLEGEVVQTACSWLPPTRPCGRPHRQRIIWSWESCPQHSTFSFKWRKLQWRLWCCVTRVIHIVLRTLLLFRRNCERRVIPCGIDCFRHPFHYASINISKRFHNWADWCLSPSKWPLTRPFGVVACYKASWNFALLSVARPWTLFSMVSLSTNSNAGGGSVDI